MLLKGAVNHLIPRFRIIYHYTSSNMHMPLIKVQIQIRLDEDVDVCKMNQV